MVPPRVTNPSRRATTTVTIKRPSCKSLVSFVGSQAIRPSGRPQAALMSHLSAEIGVRDQKPALPRHRLEGPPPLGSAFEANHRDLTITRRPSARPPTLRAMVELLHDLDDLHADRPALPGPSGPAGAPRPARIRRHDPAPRRCPSLAPPPPLRAAQSHRRGPARRRLAAGLARRHDPLGRFSSPGADRGRLPPRALAVHRTDPEARPRARRARRAGRRRRDRASPPTSRRSEGRTGRVGRPWRGPSASSSRPGSAASSTRRARSSCWAWSARSWASSWRSRGSTPRPSATPARSGRWSRPCCTAWRSPSTRRSSAPSSTSG